MLVTESNKLTVEQARAMYPSRNRKPFCKKGHPLNKDTVYVGVYDGMTRYQCSECIKERSRADKAKLKLRGGF